MKNASSTALILLLQSIETKQVRGKKQHYSCVYYLNNARELVFKIIFYARTLIQPYCLSDMLSNYIFLHQFQNTINDITFYCRITRKTKPGFGTW